ncbi:MAG: heme-binding Shp domain-containing protein [Peptostreptococcaceae bacterium]|nr:heme-binding Shp domain-containing protein [Peptostreptococcaceae bacterium]
MKIALVFLIMSSTVYADSVEIASVTAHYKHPVSGVIEDSGNNAAIGQGMTESVLDPQALIEVDSNGKIYGTFRLHLADQIGSYKISVQKGGGEFASVHMTEMQRKDNSIDVRVPLPDKDSIIKIDAFVEAMGRSVIFFGKIGSRVEGNTDFILSVDPSKKEGPSPDLTPKVPEPSIEPSPQERPGSADQVEPTTEASPADEGPERSDPPAVDPEHGLLMKGDPRLNGEREAIHPEEGPSEPVREEYGPFTMMMISSLVTVLGMFSLLALVSGIGVMIYFYVLRKSNDRREARLYGFGKKDRSV